jgi:tetraprenyl-beta-curcumene synthase
VFGRRRSGPSSRSSRSRHPASLSFRALTALAAAAIRELRWGLREVSREVDHWRTLAAAIPDDALRHDALEAIDRKRANIDGAALFWTLPRVRSPALLRLLVAYEVLADFLDCTNESGAHVGMTNGLTLHRALVEALDPAAPISDYYRYHPWTEDAGYVRALVDTCRQTCVQLPSYDTAKSLLTRAAFLTQVLALNHEPDPVRRDTVLRAWADTHFADQGELAWFEWTGGASAWLTVLALLALAAEPDRAPRDAQDTYSTYLPWMSLVGTMLDSYGDIDQDAVDAAHSYIAHYESTEAATKRVSEIVRRSLEHAGALPDGHRHLVLASCMIAMYLSKDSVRTPQTRALTLSIVHAAGSLTRLLMPVLRAWRVIYGQRST